jgi:cytochrome P450
MFSIVERQTHTKRRRMFGNIYSKSALQSSAVIRELAQTIFIERLLPVIDSAARDGTPLNMLDYSSAVYSDFTTAFVFGLQSGSNFVQDKQSRDRWLATKRLMLTPFWTLGFPPSVSSFLTKLGINLENPQMNLAMEEMNDMYLSMLQAAETLSDSSRMSREENQDRKWTEPVVYRQLLNQLQSLGGKPLPYPPPESQLRLTIASELMDHLMAGTDTSAATLAYLMQELSQRPSLQYSLREELLSLSPPILYPATAPDDDDSTPSEVLPSHRAVDALLLLDAILLETLRLHTPVAGSLPRVTPSSDPRSPITVLGYPNIPPGICVSAQAYSLHRNPEVFPDPERWKPERWLETGREKRGEMMGWFWPFGSGADMCIGNHLAMLRE